jgi:lipoprotein-releasing system permease protein
VVDWQEANKQFFGAVQTERNVMFIILTMIVIVASFNIIGSMIMLVQEKGGSIAIMRTMGMARGRVMRIFIMVGSFNGVVGTLVGVLLGLGFCYNIEGIQHFVEWVVGAKVFSPEVYFLSNLPAEVKWSEVGQVCGISLGISLLATIYPSWKASKIQPAEVLRYE